MGVSLDGIPVVFVRGSDPSRLEMTFDEYQQLQILAKFYPKQVSERLQAWKEAALSPVRGCLLCSDPPCSALLTDSFGTLLDKKRWPKHFSWDVSTELNARWVRSLQVRLRDCGMACDVDELARPDARPLPVGRASLQRRYESPHCASKLSEPLLALMPFDGDEYAMFVISGQFLSVDLTLFFMASNANGAIFHASGLRWQIRGGGHITTGLTKLVSNAERFWSVFEGRAITDLGRPLALTKNDVPRIRKLSTQYTKIMVKAGAKRISQLDFATFARYDVKTLRTFMRQHKIPWPQIPK